MIHRHNATRIYKSVRQQVIRYAYSNSRPIFGRPTYHQVCWLSSSSTTTRYTTVDGNEDKEEDIKKVELFDPSKFTHAIDVKFPDVAGNGGVVWNKVEGELIKRGDVLCDIVLEDFSFAIESEDDTDTLLGEIYVSPGDVVQPETPICSILHPESDQSPDSSSASESEEK